MVENQCRIRHPGPRNGVRDCEFRGGWVISLFLAAAAPGLTPGAEGSSMVVTNATVWTGDPARPWAEAVWVEEGRIRVVGSTSEVLADAGPERAPLDLGGRFVCPGLVDAHAHVLSFGLSLERVDLVGTRTLEETLSRVAQTAGECRAAEAGGWIRGRGWDQNDWPEERFPTRQDLDRVSGEIPASLERIDGHALWVNTRALELAGIDASTPDPDGGKIHRDAGGNPSGILVDTATELVEKVIPEPGAGAKARAIRRAAEAMARAGLTGVHDMGMSLEELAIYRELDEAGELGVRIYGSISATELRLADVLAAGPDGGGRSGAFRLGMVKFYVDGALGSRGAALLAPYADDPGNLGLLIMGGEALADGMAAALDRGFQCAVHAIGDRANRTVLDVWESLAPRYPEPWPVPSAPLSFLGERAAALPKVRIEHAQIVDPGDIPRVADLGVVASMQPTHCTSDMPWAPKRLGSDRLPGAYSWRSLVDGGALLAAGSDFPVESHDPLLGLYAAVTRRGVDGIPEDGWSPSERLSREEALVAFTAAPAYAGGDLHRLGTLTPGKLADLAVFDRNLATCDPEDLLEARCLAAVVEGRVLWAAPELAETLGERGR